jgi:phage shock protein PspC (stress-responsive transcriptional regulator)
MSLAEELEKLNELHRIGALTDEEFARAKALLLGNPLPVISTDRPRGWGVTQFLQSFTRSSTDAWIGGVCGGLGEHTPIPSWCWRVLFCVLLLGYGFGALPYLVLWICVPSTADAARAAAFQDRPPV